MGLSLGARIALREALEGLQLGWPRLARYSLLGNVLVQPEMEKRRSPLMSIPPFGRGFQGMGSFDPMEVGRRKNELSRPVHRLDEPTGLSLGMVASPQCPLPFRPAKSL